MRRGRENEQTDGEGSEGEGGDKAEGEGAEGRGLGHGVQGARGEGREGEEERGREGEKRGGGGERYGGRPATDPGLPSTPCRRQWEIPVPAAPGRPLPSSFLRFFPPVAAAAAAMPLQRPTVSHGHFRRCSVEKPPPAGAERSDTWSQIIELL